MKYSGSLDNSIRNTCFNFGSDLGHCLDPGIFEGFIFIIAF